MCIQLQLVLTPVFSLALSDEARVSILHNIHNRWKGMRNRANYTTCSEAIGVAMRDLPISEADKRECVIKAVAHMIRADTPKIRSMMVDHACQIAGVSFDRIEEVLDPRMASRYPPQFNY